jgi:hypothetical protein
VRIALPQRWLKLESDRPFQVCLIVSAAILLWWIVQLVIWIPPVSRADYLWELWGISPAIEAGRYGEIFRFVFRIIAGHIIAYSRIFGLLNWVLFDYNGTIIKYAAITTFILCWISFLSAIWRTSYRNLSAGVTLVIGTVLLCNPVPWLVLGWPESIIAYFSNWITVCFGLPVICRLVRAARPPSTAAWLAILAICFAIIVSVGSGWGILPTLVVAWLIGRGHVDAVFTSRRLLPKAIGVLVGIVVISAVGLFAITRFAKATERTFYMDDVYLSLAQAPTHPVEVARHFFSVLVALVAPWPMDVAMWFGVLLVLLWCWVILYLARAGRLREVCFWASFSVYGLIGAALNTLGRWQLTLDRSHASMPTHYGVFALPFLVGLVALVLTAHAGEARRPSVVRRGAFARPSNVQIFGLIVGAIILCSYVPAFSTGTIRFHTQRAWHLEARFGAQNYHAIHMARLSGDQAFYSTYVFQLIPDLKRMGKYRALSDDFIADSASFIAAEHIDLADAKQASDKSCGATAVGELTDIGPDLRASWNFGNQRKLSLVWAYGYALAADCRKPADFIFMADAHDKVLCVSRPGRPMLRDLPTESAVPLGRHADAVFNFSCPLAGDYDSTAPYKVYTWSRADRSLVAFPIREQSPGTRP